MRNNSIKLFDNREQLTNEKLEFVIRVFGRRKVAGRRIIRQAPFIEKFRREGKSVTESSGFDSKARIMVSWSGRKRNSYPSHHRWKESK